jgi:DNA helicase-2/ATP-dependent DNA helicase PcrA
MKKRLNVLLGEVAGSKLVLGQSRCGRPMTESDTLLGTFHSTCVKYLRKYGKRIGLNNNFSIIDQDDAYVCRCRDSSFKLILSRSKKLVSDFLKPIAQGLKEAHTPLKAQQVLSDISNAKAKSESPAGMRIRAQGLGSGGQILMVIADVSRRSPISDFKLIKFCF